MAVHLTKIYTRAGDGGKTRLSDNAEVSKNGSRVSAYGNVDETNSAIGVALALGDLGGEISELLRTVQNDLFDIGADLCTPIAEAPKYAPLRIGQSYVDRLEGWCDEYNARLAKLDSFILPGGTPGAALLHQTRCIARRAERSAWALVEDDPERTHVLPAKYLNRLSDLLFILARATNPSGDILWKPADNA